jgi:hypothetical protein
LGNRAGIDYAEIVFGRGSVGLTLRFLQTGAFQLLGNRGRFALINFASQGGDNELFH